MLEQYTYISRGSKALTADFYRSDAPDAPVCIAIHGGAWRGGASGRYQHWGLFLADNGISIFAINYTLVGAEEQTRFPAQIRDVNTAIAFVQANASRLGIDPARIGLIGDSAGAHLAALAALAPDVEAFRDPQTPAPLLALKAVVGVYGVYDLLAQFEHDLLARGGDQITQALLGVSAFANKHPYFDASPLSYAVARPKAPKFLIVWGTRDDVADHRTQSVRFLTALKQSGHAARGLPVEGAPHFWMEDPLDEPHGFTSFLAPRLLRFLRDSL